MPVIVVAGASPRAGATTVAVGLAQLLAAQGRLVRIERLPGDARADGDAVVFAELEAAAGSGAPVGHPAAPRGDEVLVLEAPAAADHAALARQHRARLVVVAVPGDPEPSADLVVRNRVRTGGPLAIPEDRVLAAPTVAQLIEASRARVLAQSEEGGSAVCERIVVGPISSDSGEPYFAAFPRKAVVTRAEKVDLALSALRTDTACLILTGGSDPSPYLLDRVASTRETTLLVAPEGTVETVRDIEGTFGRGPFAGRAKVERAAVLVADAIGPEQLAKLL